MAKPLIIQYTNLLHRYRDPQAPKVKDFVRKHHKNAVFLQRVETLNKVGDLKKKLSE